MSGLRVPLVPDQAASERAAIKPLGHARAQSPELPVGFLSSRQFELLAHALLESEIKDSCIYDRVAVMPEGADEGADVLLLAAETLVGIVQCKRYDHAVGRDLILIELLKFLLFVQIGGSTLPQGFEYQFWTAGKLTKDATALFSKPAQTLRAINTDEFNGLIDKAASKAKSLSAIELDPALRSLLRRRAEAITLTHVGPYSLARRLQAQNDVRRLFFREAGDDLADSTPEQVGVQMSARRHELQAIALKTRQGGRAPLLAPTGLADAFEDFLAGSAQAFVLIGGSGRGKTTWTARLSEHPPLGFAVDVLAAEDIVAGDDSLVTTLARLLVRRADAKGTLEGIHRALWKWLDNANRILVIDGIDRVSEAVRARLGTWVESSLRLCDNYPLKIVLTSRPEAWEPISGILAADVAGRIFAGQSERQDRAISHRLLPLSPDDAGAYYEAYGLAPDCHGSRPLNTPGLIAQFARLRDGPNGEAVTRFDVFDKALNAVISEVGLRGIGRPASKMFLDNLGMLVGQSPDGRVESGPVVSVPEGTRALDAFLHTDLIVLVDGLLRVEPDEAAEFLAARVLDVEAAVLELAARRDQPLFLGMLGLAAARLEREDRDRLESILVALIEQDNEFPVLRGTVRILSELQDHAYFEPYLRGTLSCAFPYRAASMIGDLEDLVRGLRLPAERRLALILDYADQEDPDDWRSKFWLDPEAVGRMVTPFARVAIATVRSAPIAAATLLTDRLGCNTPTAQIWKALILEAAELAPDDVLTIVWPQRAGSLRALVRDITYLHPHVAARKFLELGRNDRLTFGGASRVWHLAQHHRAVVEDGRTAIEAIADCAKTLILRTVDREAVALLKLTIARAGPLSKADQADLAGYWEDIYDTEVWDLIAACPYHREPLLDRVFAELAQGSSRSHALEFLDTSVPFELLRPRFETALALAPAMLRPVSLAVELLIHEQEARGEVMPALKDIAFRLAASLDPKVRKPLIYLAGSRLSADRFRPDLVAFRDRLLGALIEHEDGETLHTLVWKLGESARERGSATERLSDLCARFGSERVQSGLEVIALGDEAWVISELQDLLARRGLPRLNLTQ